MNIEQVNQIFKKVTSKKGYSLEVKKSQSTESWYFRICSGTYFLLVRVSDHNTQKNITTLRIDKVKNVENVERFVTNCCNGLSKRKLKSILGL